MGRGTRGTPRGGRSAERKKKVKATTHAARAKSGAGAKMSSSRFVDTHMEKKLTVVFDDGCPMCTVGMNVSDALDTERSIDFVGMNTERGKTLIKENELDMNASAYVFHPDGTKSEKSHMMRDILARNGFIGFILSLPFRVPYLNDALYKLLALIRWYITSSQR